MSKIELKPCPLLPTMWREDGRKINVSYWISTAEKVPPENQIVDTKIDDEKGVRNKQELIYNHNLWFLPDKSMYVYYTPTHWRYKAKMDGKENTNE